MIVRCSFSDSQQHVRRMYMRNGGAAKHKGAIQRTERICKDDGQIFPNWFLVICVSSSMWCCFFVCVNRTGLCVWAKCSYESQLFLSQMCLCMSVGVRVCARGVSEYRDGTKKAIKSMNPQSFSPFKSYCWEVVQRLLRFWVRRFRKWIEVYVCVPW